MDNASLRGLRGVSVVVGDLASQLGDLGMTKELVKEDVQKQLRTGGIPVLSPQEWLQTSGLPILYVQIALHTPQKVDIFSVYISIKLFENVVLERDPGVKIPAVIWASTSYVGTSNKTYLERGIRRQIEDQVDEFINAYATANKAV
jgi:hypothetical protein